MTIGMRLPAARSTRIRPTPSRFGICQSVNTRPKSPIRRGACASTLENRLLPAAKKIVIHDENTGHRGEFFLER